MITITSRNNVLYKGREKWFAEHLWSKLKECEAPCTLFEEIDTKLKFGDDEMQLNDLSDAI